MSGRVIIQVDRPVVEAEFIGEAARILKGCGKSALTTRSSIGNVAILMAGYDQDARELFHIPAARRWFQLLLDEVPHLPIFLEFEGESIKLLMLATCPLVGPSGMRSEDLKAWVQDHFLHVNFFLRSVGMTPEDPAFQPWYDRFLKLLGQMIASQRD